MFDAFPPGDVRVTILMSIVPSMGYLGPLGDGAGADRTDDVEW